MGNYILTRCQSQSSGVPLLSWGAGVHQVVIRLSSPPPRTGMFRARTNDAVLLCVIIPLSLSQKSRVYFQDNMNILDSKKSISYCISTDNIAVFGTHMQKSLGQSHLP